MRNARVEIKEAQEDDLKIWIELRHELWPHHSFEYLANELKNLQETTDTRALLALAGEKPVGFLEFRKYPHQLYIEGLYVCGTWRQHGIARQLVESLKEYAIKNDIPALASDTQKENKMSIAVHKKLGFDEADTGHNFIMKL